MTTEQIPRQVADGLAAASASAASLAWFADIEPLVTVLAGIVAIVAGSAAAWYHIERARELRRKRKQ